MHVLEAGVRYEHSDRTVESGGVNGELAEGRFLPSFHVRWDATRNDRFRVSVGNSSPLRNAASYADGA